MESGKSLHSEHASPSPTMLFSPPLSSTRSTHLCKSANLDPDAVVISSCLQL